MTEGWALIVLLSQICFLGIDELWCHRKQRRLSNHESLSHSADSFTYALAASAPLWAGDTLSLILMVVSTLLVTKDEWVFHAQISGSERWIHALLFILHPLSLWACWSLAQKGAVVGPLAMTTIAVTVGVIQFWKGQSIGQQ